jgi:hypothetical protein
MAEYDNIGLKGTRGQCRKMHCRARYYRVKKYKKTGQQCTAEHDNIRLKSTRGQGRNAWQSKKI